MSKEAILPKDSQAQGAMENAPQNSHFRAPNFSKPVNKHLLPAFQKRPLSDTPFVSINSSPTLLGSESVSPMGHLSELDGAHKPVDSTTSPQSITGSILPTMESALTDDDEPAKPRVARQHKPKRRATTLDVPGLTKSRDSPDGTIGSLDVALKLVIVMVGLPARGKSYITNKLARYLNWMHHECKVFNVGNTRRKTASHVGPFNGPLLEKDQQDDQPGGETSHSASFFSPQNTVSREIREKWAMDTLDELLDYVLNKTGSVGIFDATNTTRYRRRGIVERINQVSQGQLKILFLESICDDPKLIEQNIRLKLSGPDYKNMDRDAALKDFTERLRNYEQAYETIDEYKERKVFKKDIQYVKMINTGRKIITYNIQGFLASQTIYFLLNFNLSDRLIFVTRHGESLDNVTGRIGGDCELTERGLKFAKALALFTDAKREEFRKRQLQQFHNEFKIKYEKNREFEAQQDSDEDEESEDEEPPELMFGVWTSMLKRSIQTAQFFNNDDYFVKEMRMLNELGAGKMEGMTYKEIQEKYPNEFKLRIESKLSYRYPGLGGESYLDVINRLKPIISEIERAEDHLLLITHRVVCRILLAYFLNISREHIGDLDIPLHSVYILEPKPYGVDWSLYEFDENDETFSKVDKFKYTKRLKEIDLCNSGSRRKYSVVPSVPRTLLLSERDKYGDHNLHRLRELSRDPVSTPQIDLSDAVSGVTRNGRLNEGGPFEMSQLKARLHGVQRARASSDVQDEAQHEGGVDDGEGIDARDDDVRVYDGQDVNVREDDTEY